MKEQRATLIKPSTIRIERLLPGPVERVWAYLTESKKRATWLAAGEFDLRVGGRVELIFDNDKLSDDTPHGGGTRKFEGTITRLEPLRAAAEGVRSLAVTKSGSEPDLFLKTRVPA